MKIAVLGTGYVGLVSGVCLASKDHSVTCFDVNKKTVSQLNDGKCHIYEKDLEDLLISSNSNISFRPLDDKTEKELMEFDAIIVAVGTPSTNKRADLSQIESVARMMGRLIKSSERYISIIVKSTVVPGTTDTYFREIIEGESGKKVGDFGLGMNPEFLREGSAVEDFLFPDRIVLGYEDKKTLDVLRKIYSPWSCEKLEVNTRSAEMMKYVNNALLATLISTINEYSNLAREIKNINFDKVMEGVHLDNRWMPLDDTRITIRPSVIDYLKPGSGYGGSCFPKDIQAISTLAKDLGVPSQIISAVINVNESQPEVIIDILKNEETELTSKRVLVLGLSFKPDTDDVRESVSLKLLKLLSGQVKTLSAHDPIAMPNAKKILGRDADVRFVDNWKKTLSNIDIVIIATNWKEYIDLKSFRDVLSGKTVFDTRSLLNYTDFPDIKYITVN